MPATVAHLSLGAGNGSRCQRCHPSCNACARAGTGSEAGTQPLPGTTGGGNLGNRRRPQRSTLSLKEGHICKRKNNLGHDQLQGFQSGLSWNVRMVNCVVSEVGGDPTEGPALWDVGAHCRGVGSKQACCKRWNIQLGELLLQIEGALQLFSWFSVTRRHHVIAALLPRKISDTRWTQRPALSWQQISLSEITSAAALLVTLLQIFQSLLTLTQQQRKKKKHLFQKHACMHVNCPPVSTEGTSNRCACFTERSSISGCTITMAMMQELGSLPVWQAGVNQQPSCSKAPTRICS